MKPAWIPSTAVAIVGLLVAGYVFSVATFGFLAAGVVLFSACLLAWIVKPKEDRVLDGDNLDEAVKRVIEKLGMK